jgi:hypothetical protein
MRPRVALAACKPNDTGLQTATLVSQGIVNLSTTLPSFSAEMIPCVARDYGRGADCLRAASIRRWSNLVLLLPRNEMNSNKLTIPLPSSRMSTFICYAAGATSLSRDTIFARWQHLSHECNRRYLPHAVPFLLCTRCGRRYCRPWAFARVECSVCHCMADT